MATIFNKSKRKNSSASPKDGQKDLKQHKLVTSPGQESIQEEQQGDIISSLHIIMEEIKELKAGQSRITQQITELIDTKINDLRSELKEELMSKIDHSETYLRNECLLMTNSIDTLTSKVEAQAIEIAQLKASIPSGQSDPLNNADLTVIVSGLPVYPGEDHIMVAQNIVDNLGTDSHNVPISSQVKILQAARLPTRYSSKPPLMKISFALVLSNKKIFSKPLSETFL